MHAETDERPTPGIAVLVNGASSSGKSTLCRALQLRITEITEGDPRRGFGRVAFDDILPLIADNLFPVSLVRLQGRPTDDLISRAPLDGRSTWDYIDEGDAPGPHGGRPRVRLVLDPFGRRLLRGLHVGWGSHLALGTNLIIDHFLQEQDWAEECVGVARDVGAPVFAVGVHCSLAELERRESARGDGSLEERPLGLARRSDELCHATGLPYDIDVSTSEQTTEESVAAVIAALRSAGHLAAA